MDNKDLANLPSHGKPDSAEIEKIANAQDANAFEHDLTFLEALNLYSTGVIWSIIMSTAVVMEGYDTKLVGTLYAQPAFMKAFGNHVKGDEYQISAPWQSGLSNGSIIGQLAGLLIAGYFCERYGFRTSMMWSLLITIAFVFITFFAKSLTVLLIGQILFGIPLGFFQTITVIYALEITPMCLRAYLTNYVNFCWAFGQIICIGVLRGLLSRDDEWAYRIPFALQWVWPAILIPMVYFAPESPWWLVRRGRVDEARMVVKRLTSPKNVHFNIDKNVALMIVTTEHERAVDERTSYRACFSKVNLTRTLIVIGIYCIQILSGNPLRGSSTYFLEQAGLPTTQAFNMAIAGYAVAIVGSFFSWTLLPLFGRRTIYFVALLLMSFLLIIIGALGIPQAMKPESGYSWAVGSSLIVSSFLYNCTIGPLTNTLCSEIPSALLRSKSIVLARWVYTLTNIIVSVLNSYMLNPTAWNWSAKAGFFWGGWCLLAVIFSFFCVPETKNRTTAELDHLFERKISPRAFSKNHVDFTVTIEVRQEKTV